MTLNDRPRLRLGGISEVATELNVSRQQVAKLKHTPGFPAAVANLSIGDVWDLDAIKQWSSSGARPKRGRPGSQSSVTLGRRFKLEEEIADGGLGRISAAVDLAGGGKRIAVKVLHAWHTNDNEHVERFAREADTIKQLNSPYVISIIGHGTDERYGLWYAMELATGNLDEQLDKFPNRLDDIVDAMRHICSGLIHIHDAHVLHRDLKPKNVLRMPTGYWVIADFGFARSHIVESTGITETSVGMGSNFYTSPEQWRDAKHVDLRADVFSAGKILQALILGSTPVDDVVPSHPLRAVVLRAIAHDPVDRYQTARDLLSAIESLVATPTRDDETTEERVSRIKTRLESDGVIDQDALSELRQWAEHADRSDYDEQGALAQLLAALPKEGVQRWWKEDPAVFRRVFTSFAERLEGSFNFAACDPLANFCIRVVAVTNDQTLLRLSVRAMTTLGAQHNRWHVQDKVLSLLQKVRKDESAMSALEGLREAGAASVAWTIDDTARRTLHPILRSGIAKITSGEETSQSVEQD